MFEVTRRVEFRETDAGGVAHFSSYFGYMEEAEHALWRHLGTSVVEQTDDAIRSWPRVAAKCRYRRPVRFEDLLTIQVAVTRIGTSSVTFTFRFLHDGALVAEGEMTTVYCDFQLGGHLTRRTIPEALRRRLEAHTATTSPSGPATDRCAPAADASHE